MKNKFKKTSIISIVFLAFFIAGCSDNNSNKQTIDNLKKIPSNTTIETVKKNITPEEEAGLILMREEEKLARDVYSALYTKWGENIFNNIAKSEQAHTDAVKNILNVYQIEDPVSTDIPGSFQSAKLQNLYNNLLAQGNKSLTDALLVGATIEDVDIYDLQKLLAETTNDDIRTVYEMLLDGSYNHMRAFNKNIELSGESYIPVYITTEEYSKILSDQNFKGRGNGTGQRRN